MKGRRGLSHGESEQDFEINIASIIDCFTVLITYLLVAASFVSIGMFNVSLISEGNTSETVSNDPTIIAVSLDAADNIKLRVEGKKSIGMDLPARAGKRDLAGMLAQIAALKNQMPSLNAVMVNADNIVPYDSVVNLIESIRSQIDTVYLGSDNQS